MKCSPRYGDLRQEAAKKSRARRPQEAFPESDWPPRPSDSRAGRSLAAQLTPFLDSKPSNPDGMEGKTHPVGWLGRGDRHRGHAVSGTSGAHGVPVTRDPGVPGIAPAGRRTRRAS